MVTYSTFKNNHICFSFWISSNTDRTTFTATRHVPWAINTPKCVFDVLRSQEGKGKGKLGFV